PAGMMRTLLEAAADIGLHALPASAAFSPGQFEITLLHGEALDAADRAFRFRTMVKEVAARGGLLATFMGKPLAQEAGSGLHLHVSLNDEHERNLFDQPDADERISLLAPRLLVRALAHAPTLIGMPAPHSYHS